MEKTTSKIMTVNLTSSFAIGCEKLVRIQVVHWLTVVYAVLNLVWGCERGSKELNKYIN